MYFFVLEYFEGGNLYEFFVENEVLFLEGC